MDGPEARALTSDLTEQGKTNRSSSGLINSHQIMVASLARFYGDKFPKFVLPLIVTLLQNKTVHLSLLLVIFHISLNIYFTYLLYLIINLLICSETKLMGKFVTNKYMESERCHGEKKLLQIKMLLLRTN